MSRYEIIKSLHVLVVIAWVGSAILTHVLANRAYRSNDPDKIAHFTSEAAWAGPRFFTPLSFAALGFGIWLVADGPWGFGDLWIVLGLIGFGLTAAIGAGFLGPTSERLTKLQAERGPTDPEALKMLRRIMIVSRIDLLILVAVVFDMVAKPGT